MAIGQAKLEGEFVLTEPRGNPDTDRRKRKGRLTTALSDLVWSLAVSGD